MRKNVLKKLLKSHKWDFILAAVLLSVAICLLLISMHSRKSGTYVRVKQDNKIIGEYPLNVDSIHEITDFDGTNTLVIKDGKAYVTLSSCNDRICEHMGKISKNGEMIICLPHRLFIEIINSDGEDYDAISQ